MGMNLISYAVSQKISGKGELLEHILAKKDVSAGVIEESFSELLKKYEDLDAEQLVGDYKEFLRNNIQLSLVTKDVNHFEVSGEVKDEIIEAIEGLHGVNREELFKDLVELTVSNLVGDREIEISELDVKSSVVEKPVVDFETITAVEDEVEEVAYIEPETVAPEYEYEEIDFETPDFEAVDDYENIVFEEADGEIVEAPVIVPNVSEHVDDKTKKSIREIYREFIQDLKDKGLDQRLGLTLEAA